ncbi:hypothetical protein ACFPYI_04540 [Halomarina salina]|uniref:Uncharacterized protein n=1 Tax=Halomarina salina TaxID=1872699 RepID=A0ABD5RJ54_9EURY|nr:hypothetical protein [Halomarina salina]
MQPSTSRRHLLATSTGALVALAGCSALGDDVGDDGPEPFRLGRVQLDNRLETPQEVGLRVERDGERVHDETYRLDAAPAEDRVSTRYAPVKRFGCVRGVYRLEARLGDGDWSGRALSSEYAGHLIELEVREGDTGPEVGILVEAKAPRRSCPGATKGGETAESAD